jgi:hypothetical protein
MAIIIKKKASAPRPDELITRDSGNTLDSMCLCVLKNSPNSAIPWWLIASWSYYCRDVPLISDGLYDEMAKAMLDAWDDLEHPHKHLITRGDLEVGSLYALKDEDYPRIVKYAAANLARNELGVTITV